MPLLSATATLAIRAARDTDAKSVIGLLEDAKLESGFDPREFVVLEEAGRVVACARLRTFPTGAHELASVAVAPARRGARLGEAIVAAALERAQGAVYALAVAPGFFARQGFEPLATIPEELEEKARGMCASSGAVPMRWSPSHEATVDEIRRRYARAAQGESCCVNVDAYSDEELASLPEGAHLGLGTGNPVREAAIQPGETVLDLGCGAGGDLLLAARAVGPSGRAIGVDFTPEMVARAREHAALVGATHVEIHKAPIEAPPLPDASVDVVISNCVVNLSLDKPAVLREAYRMLRPGGRLVVSDTMRLGALRLLGTPTCDCTGGALSAGEWRQMLQEAGFVDARVEEGPRRAGTGTGHVRARKPAA